MFQQLLNVLTFYILTGGCSRHAEGVDAFKTTNINTVGLKKAIFCASKTCAVELLLYQVYNIDRRANPAPTNERKPHVRVNLRQRNEPHQVGVKIMR